jgi:hypothetical protein
MITIQQIQYGKKKKKKHNYWDNLRCIKTQPQHNKPVSESTTYSYSALHIPIVDVNVNHLFHIGNKIGDCFKLKRNMNWNLFSFLLQCKIIIIIIHLIHSLTVTSLCVLLFIRTLALYPRRGGGWVASSGISNIPPRHPRFTKISYVSYATRTTADVTGDKLPLASRLIAVVYVRCECY